MAQTRSGFFGETVTPMMPTVSFGRPSLRVISIQVSPLSVLFHRPEPFPPDERL